MTHALRPDQVFPELRRFLLADGLELVLDLQESRGTWLRDRLTGEKFLDFFTCFASWGIGYNHPRLRSEEFREEIVEAATHKPSNSDLYSVAMAEFVKEFGERTLPQGFRHLFLVSGGSLGVENALKAAFDWKVRRNLAAGVTGPGGAEVGTKILHFREAFHGRSGYTLSLTNTADPRKTKHFPKFDWPRVLNPKIRFPMEGENLEATLRDEVQSVAEIEKAFDAFGADIAAVIVEPIQCEGGDNHFRPEFLAKLREICDRREAMLIFDEVQVGFYGTGKAWCFQHLGVVPDLVAFGKKAQVCGFFAGPRIDEVPQNVFVEGSRINSTWGANLADMVRSKWIQRAILEEGMAANALEQGAYLVDRLRELGTKLGNGWVAAARGRGTILAFDCPTKEGRDALLKRCFANRLLALSCGTRSIRFRPPLNVTRPEADQALSILGKALADLGVAPGSNASAADQASRIRAQKDAPGGALERAK